MAKEEMAADFMRFSPGTCARGSMMGDIAARRHSQHSAEKRATSEGKASIRYTHSTQQYRSQDVEHELQVTLVHEKKKQQLGETGKNKTPTPESAVCERE